MTGLSISEPSYAQKGSPRTTPGPVNLQVTTHLGDQQVFLELDVISFLISLDQAAYLYAFYRDASGQVFQLMPGQAQSNHFFEPGFFIPFPAEQAGFELVVQAPFGEEQLWLFASDSGQLDFPGTTEQGFKNLRQTWSQLAGAIKSGSPRLYGQTRLIIHTQGR